MQGSLFGPDHVAHLKPGDRWTSLRVLITVKAAPNPSAVYGETVCVAGLSLDPDRPGWIRLYPINFRDLELSQQFRKYQIVRLRARPARNDPRVESWRPDVSSLRAERRLAPWRTRRPHIEPFIDGSMCAVRSAVIEHPPARSLAAIRPRKVDGIDIERHPGWTSEEQAKIDRYVNQLAFADSDRTALEAPRFKAWYRYRCWDRHCAGHRQGILDWEFVALQRKLTRLDDEAAFSALRSRFFGELCGPGREVAFFVGNQAKRPQTFSVVGVYYPKR